MAMRDWLPSLLSGPKGRPATISLQRDVDRFFQEFQRRFDASGLFAGRDFVPEMEVKESADTVTLTLELPGVDPHAVDISVEDDTITVSGEKKSETEVKDGDKHHSERSYGRFHRALSMPAPIDADKVEAKFDKGVLTITFPKPATPERPARKIPIQS